MLSANARIAVRHAWESYWYEWPLNLRGLLYYSKNDDFPDKTNSVYLLGNPLVIWPMAALMLLTVVMTIFYMRCVRGGGSVWGRAHAAQAGPELSHFTELLVRVGPELLHAPTCH